MDREVCSSVATLKLNGVTQQESDNLLKWFYDLVKDHSLQVRHKWQSPNDIGIKLPTPHGTLEQLR